MMIAAMDPKERKARWAEYMRTLVPRAEGTRGPVGNEKVPEELSHKLMSPSEKKLWYPIWIENYRKWANVKLTETFLQTTRETETGLQAWMTRSQLVDLHKDEEIADAVISTCMVDPSK